MFHRRGQKFFLLNLNAMARAITVCFYAVGSTETILKILMFTKQSSTPALAYRRFKANGLHAQTWYKYPIKNGTKWEKVYLTLTHHVAKIHFRAWKSLETVRKMHVVVNRRTTKAGVGIISQKDMAICHVSRAVWNCGNSWTVWSLQSSPSAHRLFAWHRRQI